MTEGWVHTSIEKGKKSTDPSLFLGGTSDSDSDDDCSYVESESESEESQESQLNLTDESNGEDEAPEEVSDDGATEDRDNDEDHGPAGGNSKPAKAREKSVLRREQR